MARKSKPIPTKIVHRYIELDAQLDVLTTEYDDIKVALRNMHSKGCESDLLNFIPASRQQIDWKKELDRVTKRLMLPAVRRVFYKRLNDRYPAKPIAEKIVIVGKERKSKSSSSKESAA